MLPEIPLAPGTLFIGDLHLDPLLEGAGSALTGWLARCHGVPRIVILGDLFDTWIGPAHGRFPEAGRIFDALRASTSTGTRFDFVPGNRDFLLTDFAERAGGTLHPAGCVGVGPDGGRWLLVHGDELCTRDRGYQRLKRVLRSAPLRGAVPLVPTPVGLWLARRLRRSSARALAFKPSAEKAQQGAAVVELSGAQRCTGLVCGHAHRYRDERPDGAGGPASGPRWLGLAAFGAPLDVLRMAEDGRVGAESSTCFPPAGAWTLAPHA